MRLLFPLLLFLAIPGLGAGEPLLIQLTCDDLLRFSKTELSVRKGQEVTLTLENVGKIPALRHNFVLLAPGVNIVSFGNAAQKAEEQDYIPPEMADKIIAHTRLISSGETDRISFVLNQSGRYEYVCSYPGHQAVSRGTLIVEEQ